MRIFLNGIYVDVAVVSECPPTDGWMDGVDLQMTHEWNLYDLIRHGTFG